MPKSKTSKELFLADEELAYGARGPILNRPFRAQLDGAEPGVTVTGKAGVPDTFFSIPAFAYIKGKRTRGFIMMDDGLLLFVPYKEKSQ